MKEIFNILNIKKFLDIIKFNKKLHEETNINFNDYKYYSETYSTIEVELIPVKNKSGMFIYENKVRRINFFSYIYY